MNRRTPLEDSLGDHFSVRDGLASGASEGRLRAHDLRTEFRGVRSRVTDAVESADAFERETRALARRCAAYLAVAPEGAAFSHITAARLHGLALPSRISGITELHVTLPSGSRPPRRVGVVGHTSAVLAPVEVDGIRIVRPELAWLQLAPELSVDELVVAGDVLVRRKLPLSTLVGIEQLLDVSSRARGIRRARVAFADIRAGTDSPPESRLRLCLVRAGLPEPMVHYEVHDADGFFVGTPDLAYVAERIAIEYQGRHHWERQDVFEDDIIRRELFRRAGWHVLLVTSRTLSRPASLSSEVRVLLAERAGLR